MAKHGQNRQKSSWWRRLRKAVARWASAPSSNRDAILVAFIGGAFFSAGGTLLLDAFKGIDLGIQLPVWVTAILALLALGVGSLLTLCGTKKLRSRRRRSQLSPAGTLGAYAEHVRLLFSYTPFDIDRILAAAAGLVEKGTGSKVHLSLWEPGTDDEEGQWTPSYRPTHTVVEADDFQVPIDGSWIAHKQTLHKPGAIIPLADITVAAEGEEPAEPDLKAFLKHGCRCLLCCRFPYEMDGEQPTGRTGPCLVMLSEIANSLTVLEERYLQLLATVFSMRFREQRLADQLGGGAEATE